MASPDHRDLCNLIWNESEPWETLFWMAESRKYFRPDDPPVSRGLSDWVLMGGDHILRGWDHLAFVIALIVRRKLMKPALVVSMDVPDTV